MGWVVMADGTGAVSMYNLLISLAISAGLFGAVAVFLGWQPAILPALFAFPVLMFFLARRTGAS